VLRAISPKKGHSELSHVCHVPVLPDGPVTGMYPGPRCIGYLLCSSQCTGVSYIQVHVDSNATVAGYPGLLVRQALRKLRNVDTWNSGMLEAAAGLPAGAGRELAQALAAQGLMCQNSTICSISDR
jgi:hypothetical protein